MNSGYRLAAFTKNRLNPAYAGARMGIDRLAAAADASVEHYVPVEPDSVSEQIAMIEDVLKRPPDAILLTVNHPTQINPSIAKIHAAGIPLFMFTSKPAGIDCVTYVCSDDRALAYDVAGYLLDHMGGKGRIVVLRGHPDSLTTLPRDRGFEDAINKRPGASIAAMETGNYQAAPAKAVVADLLRKGVAFDGIVAANDIMGIGALEAMAEAGGPKVPMVAINATPDGIEAIKRGDMLATASFDAMKMACVATLAALRHLQGMAVPQEVLLPVEIVDVKNYAAWDLLYEERDLPTWEEIVGA